MIETDRSRAGSRRIAALPAIAVLAAFGLLLVGPAASAAAASRWVGPTAVPGIGRQPAGVQTAIAPDGEMLAVWATFGTTADGHIAAASRTPGGEWSPPEVLSEAQHFDYGPTVAFGADGSAVVAWEVRPGEHTLVEARTRSADGTWAPTETFGEGNFFTASPAVAVGSAGEAVVAWSFSDENPGVLESQAATSIDGHWSAARTIPGSPEIFGAASLAPGPEGGRLKPAMHVFGVRSVDAARVESAIRTVKFFAGKRHQRDAT